MDMDVILFFGSVLIVVALICRTTLAVTNAIIDYKTKKLELEGGQLGARMSSHSDTLGAPVQNVALPGADAQEQT